jgi:hypothetical protein
MSATNIVTSVIKSTPHLTRLGLSLGWLYLTLDSRVRATRKAFEKQLTAQGMSKEDAQRLSACFEDLKNDLTLTLKQGMVGGLRRADM